MGAGAVVNPSNVRKGAYPDRLTPAQMSFLRRLERGACPHAFLVEAPRGVGKRAFAAWCAGALLCHAPQGARRPCGTCDACCKIAQGFHPDLHWYGEGEKAISVGDVRALIRETELVPAEGDRSVYILCHAERMQSAAQNALLKVLEEPPPGVVIFLLTESRRALLPTVRSRGQLLTLPPLPDDVLEAALRTQYPRATEEERTAAVRLAQGSPGLAEEYVTRGAVQAREKAQEWLRAVMGSDKYHLILLLTAKAKRETLLPLVDLLLRLLFDLLLARMGASPLLLSETEAKTLASGCTGRALAAMCEQTLVARERLETNGNATATMTWLATALWSSASGQAL